MLALKPAAQRFAPFSGTSPAKSKLMSSENHVPAPPAALTPARPEPPTAAPATTAARAASGADKNDTKLTSRTLAGPNAPSKAQNSARARDAKSMPKATGRWTAEEHDEFLKCLDIYGREWKKVAERITTRTAAQIRSHAQKHFKKLEAAGETVSPPQAKAAKPKKRKGAKGAAPPAKKPKK